MAINDTAAASAGQALAMPNDPVLDEVEAALIARHIYLDPNPAEARLAESGANVWALVGYRDANIAGLEEIADAYGLSHDAVRAAFAFYRRHRAAIDGRLAANE